MAQVTLSNVTVEFPIHNGDTRSLQLHLLSAVGGTIAEHKKTLIIRALENVHLEIKDGDRVGIIGHNGSGKTTLLRVIAGVYEPSHGTVQVNGKISSFTDITLGMDPEATGYDNIIFRCVFMGLTFAEAHKLAPSIAEFSELGDFLKVPVRTYSTGMFIRLAFAISTATHPEIIIMDEMIGTGDARFIAKAEERLKNLLQRVKILVVATHNETILRNMCNRLVWLDHGQIRMFGNFNEVLTAYSAANA